MVWLRNWRIDDAKTLYDLCKDKTLRKDWNYQYLYPYSNQQAEECIQFYQNANPIRFLIQAIVEDDQVCGFIQCEVKGYGTAEISYWLHSSYRDHGIMHEAVHQMCAKCFSDFHVLTIYARVKMENIASQHVLIQNGFLENRETVPVYMYFRHKDYVYS